MERKTNIKDEKGGSGHEHPLPHEISNTEKQQAFSAHQQADEDMEEDAELTAHSPSDDLDEGETARLGENNDLI